MMTEAKRASQAAATSYRRLIEFTTVLTLCLIMLGAYVRLSDAGLGCPDWPGCYGKVLPSAAHADIGAAVSLQGGEHGPVSMGKAWREMGHRYVAILLGFLVIAIVVQAWRLRDRLRQSPWLATTLLAVVVLQGLFGKWTVTLLLKPAIVTGHLLGGLLTLALLVWLGQRQRPLQRYVDAEPVASLSRIAWLGLAVLGAQIMLGGWTSANYAGLACPDLPTCQGMWWPATDFAASFHIFRELGMTAEGTALPLAALTAIQLAHRIGALFAAAVLSWLAWRIVTTDGARGLGWWLFAALLTQLTLGVGAVLAGLPLWVAVAHNGVAAVMVALLVTIVQRAECARLRV